MQSLGGMSGRPRWHEFLRFWGHGVLGAAQQRGSGMYLQERPRLLSLLGRCLALGAEALKGTAEAWSWGQGRSCQKRSCFQSCLLCFCRTFPGFLLLGSYLGRPHLGGCGGSAFFLSLKLPLEGLSFLPDFGNVRTPAPLVQPFLNCERYGDFTDPAKKDMKLNSLLGYSQLLHCENCS